MKILYPSIYPFIHLLIHQTPRFPHYSLPDADLGHRVTKASEVRLLSSSSLQSGGSRNMCLVDDINLEKFLVIIVSDISSVPSSVLFLVFPLCTWYIFCIVLQSLDILFYFFNLFFLFVFHFGRFLLIYPQLRDSFLNLVQPTNKLIKGSLHFCYSAFDRQHFCSFLSQDFHISAFIVHLLMHAIYFID